MRNLTDAAENARVLDRAGHLLSELGPDVVEADERASEHELVASADPVELEALRCARSRWVLERALSGREAHQPAQLSVVWAMYGETGRLQPSGPANPHGEDLLRAKVDQVSWLTNGLPIDWEVVAVDDGCPDEPSSAVMAADIAAAEGWDRLRSDASRPQVRVLRLADAIGPDPMHRPTGLGPAFGALATTADSRKGGSIVLGLAEVVATAPPQTDHVVLYTDADLSANIAQAGLLAGPILCGDTDAVAGQRYGVPAAVLVKEHGASSEPMSTGSKPDKMIVLFRHFVRATLMPELAAVIDTQAGFKAFDAAVLAPALRAMTSFDESFDVELLIRVAEHSSSLRVAPIVFVEDFAQTNFPSVDPGQRHLDMINQLVGVYDDLVAPTRPVSGDGAAVLELCRGLTLTDYVTLIERLRADDERSVAAGDPDPLFDRRWTAAELAAAMGR